MGGNYATVDIAGAGVTEFGPWIDAILEFVVQCRGDIGQSVDCHGLNYVLAPKLELQYFSPEGAVMTDEHIKMYEVSLSPELYIARTSIGWLYRAPVPGEYGKWKPIDAYPTYGPFETPEEAARDAAERLNLRPSWLFEPAGEEISETLRNTEVPRLRQALHEAVNLRKR